MLPGIANSRVAWRAVRGWIDKAAKMPKTKGKKPTRVPLDGHWTAYGDREAFRVGILEN